MQTFSVHARNPDARFTIATNRGTDQEVSALALHLIQASLVYVNTRMVQSVLGDLGWAARLSSDDLRGLETVIYTHINPYLVSAEKPPFWSLSRLLPSSLTPT